MHFIHIKYAVKNDEICGVNIVIFLLLESQLD